jgi:general secretion pathway protein C
MLAMPQLDQLKNKLNGAFKPKLQQWRDQLLKLDGRNILEGSIKLVKRQNVGTYGTALTILLCSYFAGDIIAILIGSKASMNDGMAPVFSNVGRRNKSLDDYNVIMTRNLFNSKGLIPGEEIGNPNETDSGGAPVKTSLPFNLIGTLILRDELRSIATIEDSSAKLVYPVRIEDEIPQKAKILKVEAKKVIFLNTSNHRREYVELPDDGMSAIPNVSLGTKGSIGGGQNIEQVANGQFVISRSEVDRALSDLNNILTQARAIPNFENGQPAGYKLFQIVPGSIYQKLGIQEGDVICGFDGQPATDPAAALEKLTGLRNTSHMDLCVKRGGKQQTFSYDFR